MNDATRTGARVAAWTAAAVLGMVTIGGLAQAQSATTQPQAQPQAQSSETASPAPSSNASPRPSRSAQPRPKPSDGQRRKAQRGPARFGRRVLHGETVMSTDNGPVTHVVQRGVVTATSASSITVRSSDGFTLTWTRDAETKVRTGPKDQPQRPLAVGDDVMVHGVRRSASAVLARQVRVVPEGEQRAKRDQPPGA